MAEALAHGYKDVYARNEYAHVMPKDKFKSLIVEMTGEKPGSSTVNAIVGTFFALKAFANFDAPSKPDDKDILTPSVPLSQMQQTTNATPTQPSSGTGINLSYTINLNLPETTDVNVFNAIFCSLKEHLLKN